MCSAAPARAGLLTEEEYAGSGDRKGEAMSVRCQQATKEHGVLKQTGLVCLWCLGVLLLLGQLVWAVLGEGSHGSRQGQRGKKERSSLK